MKNYLRLSSGLVLISFLLGCNNSTPDSVKSAKELNAKRIDTEAPPGDSLAVPLTKDDADFLVNIASGVMLEKQLGQMAIDNSGNQRVKDLGALIVSDQNEATEKLKKLAAAKNVTLPAEISNQQQKQKEDLMKKKGIEFDRSYVDITVNDYNKDIRNFGKAAKYASDPDVKSFASNSLPLLYAHLDSARNLQKIMKKKIDITTAVPK
jgi:putative membrane protein